MDASLRHLLSELEEAGRRNDEQEQDRSRKMLTGKRIKKLSGGRVDEKGVREK